MKKASSPRTATRPFIPYRTIDLAIMRYIYDTRSPSSPTPDSGGQMILRYGETEGIYWVDPRIMGAFCRSSRVTGFVLPLPVFWVPTALEHGKDALIGTPIQNPTTGQTLILQGFFFGERVGGYEMLLCWGWEGDDGGMDADGTEHHILLDYEGEVDWLAIANGDEALAAQFRTESKERHRSLWTPSKEEGLPLSGEGGEFNLDAGELRSICDLLWRIAGNLCMWITHMQRDIEEITTPKKSPSKAQDEANRLLQSAKQRKDRNDILIANRHLQAAKQIEAYRISLLGRRLGEKIEVERSVVETERTRVRHVVGGHGKWQVHGPRNSLRKWIYVSLYLRGGAGEEDEQIVPTVKKISPPFSALTDDTAPTKP